MHINAYGLLLDRTQLKSSLKSKKETGFNYKSSLKESMIVLMTEVLLLS